jgi:cytoskeletal protein RodZ
MESFGEYLRNLREERGIALEEIAQRTRIAVSNLEFLEKDRYELLPPRVFVKGFIRSYATELGLDQEDLLARFDSFTKQGELPDYEEEHPLFQQPPPLRSFIGGTVFTTVLTAAGVLALGILLITGFTRLFYWGDNTGGAVPKVTTVGPSSHRAPISSLPEGDSVHSTAFREPPRAQAGRKVLEIKALANAWVRVESDNSPAEELIMAPGDVQIFTAKESFQLQTGNAGGIRLRFEGRELPPLGKNNQTLSLTLP